MDKLPRLFAHAPYFLYCVSASNFETYTVVHVYISVFDGDSLAFLVGFLVFLPILQLTLSLQLVDVCFVFDAFLVICKLLVF